MNSEMVSAFFVLLHWSVVIGLALRVIMRRVPIGVSMAWLAVIASMPFLGAVLYLLFGEKRLGRGRARRMRGNSVALEKWKNSLAANEQPSAGHHHFGVHPLRSQARRVVGYPALPGNRIQLLESSAAVFDSLIADIDAARTRCHLCFYIWFEAGRTMDVVEALIRAAKRGVDCRALADAVGSKAFLHSESARRMREAGVMLLESLPAGLWRTLFIRRDLRNHRKIAVIDGSLAYTGSQNLVDPHFFKQGSGVGEWVDAIARITGPTAACLDSVFEFDWALEAVKELQLAPYQPTEEEEGEGALVQVVPSGPDLRPEAIHQLLLTAIYSARDTLVITTPYFVPDEAMITALLSAAQSGVCVTLVVPARNDSFLVRYASVAHFDDLMTAGVRIALFEGGLLHTKSLVVDGRISVFGSVNLDMRSLWLNFEISLFVYDRDFTRQLCQLQDTYLEKSTLLDLATWRERPMGHRFLENTLRLIGPLL